MFLSKKQVEPKWLHSGAIFMSTGWPPFRKKFHWGAILALLFSVLESKLTPGPVIRVKIQVCSVCFFCLLSWDYLWAPESQNQPKPLQIRPRKGHFSKLIARKRPQFIFHGSNFIFGCKRVNGPTKLIARKRPQFIFHGSNFIFGCKRVNGPTKLPKKIWTLTSTLRGYNKPGPKSK